MTTFDRMKKLCNDRKISINDLENALGYSKNTLYRLKTQTPGADKLKKIAEYFDVSVDYLLGLTDNPSRISQPATEGNGFLRIDLSGVPEEDKDTVVEQLETFKNFLISETAKEAERRKNGNNN